MGKEKKVKIKEVKKYSDSRVSDATLKSLKTDKPKTDKPKTDKPKLFSLENVKAKDVLDVGIKGLEVAKGKSMEALPDSGTIQAGSKQITHLDQEFDKDQQKIRDQIAKTFIV